MARLGAPEASRCWKPSPGGHRRAVCRVLASLVTAGVDLPRAMAVTAEASNNAVYTKGLNHIREQMMEGNGLADPAR